MTSLGKRTLQQDHGHTRAVTDITYKMSAGWEVDTLLWKAVHQRDQCAEVETTHRAQTSRTAPGSFSVSGGEPP